MSFVNYNISLSYFITKNKIWFKKITNLLDFLFFFKEIAKSVLGRITSYTIPNWKIDLDIEQSPIHPN
jgi:hypothetical protein